jgi:pimeloyl-ACP methyl ester carboxylesterase
MKIALALILVALLGAGWYLYNPDHARGTLERLWAPAPSQFVEVAGVRLHIRDTGPRDGPAVLLIHGFGSSLHTWEAWALLLENRFRVVALDLPGFGLTGPDPTGDYSDERSVAVLVALLDRLGIGQAAVVGSSMGGRIAWRFAAAELARVCKLVLMAPDGFASFGREYGRTPERLPWLMRLLPYTAPKPLLERTMRNAYAVPGTLTDAMVERYHAMLLAPGVRRAILDCVLQTRLLQPEPILARRSAHQCCCFGASGTALCPPLMPSTTSKLCLMRASSFCQGSATCRWRRRRRLRRGRCGHSFRVRQMLESSPRCCALRCNTSC